MLPALFEKHFNVGSGLENPEMLLLQQRPQPMHPAFRFWTMWSLKDDLWEGILDAGNCTISLVIYLWDLYYISIIYLIIVHGGYVIQEFFETLLESLQMCQL